ncbi:MAG: acetylpolyamine amidohydrolase AphB [Anaerolineae bacterium]
MPDQRITTLYTPHHMAHAPAVEFLHGHKATYFEKPQRLDEIHGHLQQAGLATIQQPEAALPVEVIKAVHDPEMVDFLQEMSAQAVAIVRTDLEMYGMGDQVSHDPYYYEWMYPKRFFKGQRDPRDRRRYFIFDSTAPIGKGTWQAVYESANLAYVGAEMLVSGAEKQVYTMCRPPGHHAGRDYMGGYCFLNNAAIAAHTLRTLGKVAILDIDYHHGNGTQDIFWNDANVLFISIHADPAVEYPYYSGFADETGSADSRNATLNYPLPHGSTEAEYLHTLDQAVAHIQDFAPSALVISLGFDTYKEDPMAEFELDLGSYTKIGQRIAALGLPTLYVQEGGYYIPALGAMAVSFFRGVLNR